jgi:PIN domain nuclease of toxin-antitoxin system
LTPRLLLDTHVVLRVLTDTKKLSREQRRYLQAALGRTEPVALSAITLLEVAVLLGDRSQRIRRDPHELFSDLQANPVSQILPLTFEIASEVISLGGILRDPADRAIVATARVHQLRLVTSDQRIIESKLVPVIE